MDARTVAPPVSHLASVLRSGQFAVAAELSPPKGVNLESIARDARTLKGYADAVNVTDNQAASVRMASIRSRPCWFSTASSRSAR